VEYETHKENCHINHKGSSGKMEVDAMFEMFQRSQELYGVKCSNYIEDGDAKTFKTGADSWCAYRVAEASNETLSYNHPPPLHQDVHEKILPI